ncbi:T9SS C-terminal target domain-containing protein [Flavobacterium luteum]|uniref:T9SS C-terminal target domain-containing protein n=1 Tax=Flavobacterium luteum TaxID=2026654 RepID=A0A7J5AD26_9FLAO|nr:T9SS C-terminal target domain-containing protein [Flavobacterium luteum]KAB1155472.1 T9SS C-terminal target domain-containing protein [Flavobacterium luteum]
MKYKKNCYRVFLFALLSFVYVAKAQKIAIPISSYGTWDRGEGIDDYDNPKADFVMGIEVGARWADVQPNGPNKFDFSVFQNTLDRAAKYHKIVKMSINVGGDAPMWLFKNGVPLVNVKSNKPKNDKYADSNPYYLNETYKNYYFELIKQFSLFLRNQPKNKFDCISFVQVKTGSTGDEEPYKGNPYNKTYIIPEDKWEAFRLESFTQFKKYFNDVSDRQIVLTFNNVDPEKQPEAFNWVMTKIDPKIGFGLKGGAYNRGHHLTGEQSFKKQWTPYLINPKGMKLFSASEMDQSWQKPIFNINKELGFYWAALGAINTGLSSTNMSKGAIQFGYEHKEISDIFRMYNKYAQQVYPATATAAVCVFHEGLNVADKVKFPESKFGNANAKNLDRYAAICNDSIYKSHGAKMDDLEAAAIGQVNQREKQTGYNDAGWDIAEGNYERFLTQINPDETSIGLFRVRGAIDKKSSKYDRFARSFENATDKNTMYFKFDDEMFANSKPKKLKFTITWLDKNVGSTWSLQYNNGKQMKTVLEVKGKGDNKWKTQIVDVADMSLDHSGPLQSDFVLVNTDKTDDIFNGIEVDIQRN